jgi:hypothetical protein
MKTAGERRQFRRAELDVPVAIRVLDAEGAAETAITGQVKNVSLVGIYCYVKDPSTLKAGQQVICSLSVPPEQTRLFPFSSVHGRGWVVRAEPVPMGRRAGESPTSEQLLGLAVAFAPDVTALGTIEF